MFAQKLKNNKIALGNSAPRKDALEVIDDLKTSEFCRILKAAREWNESINDNRDIVFTQYENEHSKVCKEFDRILNRRKSFKEKLDALDLDGTSANKNGIEDKKDKVIEESNSNKSAAKDKEYKPAVVWNSNVKGTSRLLRIPKKQIIKIIRRKGLIDDNNRPNSVCIDNNLREQFFADVKKTHHFAISNLYELMYSETDNPEIYEKWSSIITQIYEDGLAKLGDQVKNV